MMEERLSLKNLEENFRELTWNDLQNWVGSRTLKRGEDYFKRGRVTNLRIAPTGILARVSGTDEYTTLVTIHGQGQQKEITSDCTCPYGSGCKHAVATVLAFSQAIKDKRKVPTAQSTDPDIMKMKGLDDGEYEEDDYDDPGDTQTRSKKSSAKSTPDNDIAEFLDQHDKEFLKKFVITLANRYPEVYTELLDSARLAGGKVEKLISSIRQEIDNIISEPAWRNHWSDEGNPSDFSRVKSMMLHLFDQGYYDAVTIIAGELLDKGNSYVETCDDEGDSALQISECLEIGFKAVKKCEWPNVSKIMFIIEAELQDEYDLCGGAYEILESIRDKSAWSAAADDLSDRLADLPSSKNSNSEFSSNYRRDRISNFLISALEKSGRNEEILPLCEEEAKITGSWVRYVERLIGAKKYDEARKAAEEGIKQVGQKYPGIGNTLREHIAKLAEKSGDYDSILFLRQEEFLEYPCLKNYNKLIEAAVNTKSETTIRDWALQFLETGNVHTRGDLKSPQKIKERYSKSFPAYDVLIDIADKEKDADKVLHWYRQSYAKDRWFSEKHVQVAHAIAGKYPDEALKIWCALAENQIALTKPSAYETAVGYLKQVRDIYRKTHRTKEWESYVAVLRESNKKKIRFIQSLRTLTGERII
ncbi:MAG: SWIM zinc finger domain-containing protein [Candidatus Brocadia sp. AMX2]|uniref:Uncharacterized conserved protein n=1 Tax=Candidatus Brocadia sinica JPN1 TaxID=1197129 RepID=A0ABQ0JWQ1_9BACT|nr:MULTISPECIES: SWIM zinc finger family protein [Brocadia]MBC6931120.1 SWIM zinc finger domain-containing protein [Candidatus Brocadia sp.]MBL1167481.1 SWIM zinc finger domain-containing protein [Candidatus Brocadia sp. AMX1]GIK12984.1 MAG: hypothetical protein BroJett002_16910 [Candidatus Brocadia sinica]KAA0244650.1 MAG: SWIM zinc finger domain-containing protein [Candidatus Brocadia sp. AMX2]MCE7865795.1 SWIM zinc finger domain-containing protein [Candidatus Brocadia sp. AMX2]